MIIPKSERKHIPGATRGGSVPKNCGLLVGKGLPEPVEHRLPECPWWTSTDELYDFQVDALNRLLAYKRVTLWAKRGAGKTAVSIAWMLHRFGPRLVVTPEGVTHTFAGEIKKRCNLEPIVIRGYKPYDINPTQDNIHIIGWLTLIKWLNVLPKYNFKTIVFDEIHWGKNHRRAKQVVDSETGHVSWARIRSCGASARALSGSKSVDNVLSMTGTGLPDSKDDLWGQLDITNPYDWGTYKKFSFRYCGAFENDWGGLSFLPQAEANKEELKKRLEWSVVSIPDEIVNKEMPEARRELMWVPPKNQSITPYEKDIKKSIRAAKKQKMAGFAAFHHGIAMATWAKWGDVSERVRSSLESGENILIFVLQQQQVDALHTLSESLIKKHKIDAIVLKAHGKLSEKNNEAAREIYMERGGSTVLITTYALNGTGVNLQRTDLEIMMSLPWSPDVLLQAEGRAVRLGGDRKVTILYPIAVDNAADETVFSKMVVKLPAVKDITGDISSGEILNTFQTDVSQDDLLDGFLAGMGFDEQED